MSSSELLRKIGQNLNPRPKPDALGRRPATPLEIQQAINGTYYHNEQVIYEKPQRSRHRRR